MNDGPRCAYCHDSAGPAPAECPRCGTLLHAVCLNHVRECPTYGCSVAVRGCGRHDRPLTPLARAAISALALLGRL